MTDEQNGIDDDDAKEDQLGRREGGREGGSAHDAESDGLNREICVRRSGGCLRRTPQRDP